MRSRVAHRADAVLGGLSGLAPDVAASVRSRRCARRRTLSHDARAAEPLRAASRRTPAFFLQVVGKWLESQRFSSTVRAFQEEVRALDGTRRRCSVSPNALRADPISSAGARSSILGERRSAARTVPPRPSSRFSRPARRLPCCCRMLIGSSPRAAAAKAQATPKEKAPTAEALPVPGAPLLTGPRAPHHQLRRPPTRAPPRHARRHFVAPEQALRPRGGAHPTVAEPSRFVCFGVVAQACGATFGRCRRAPCLSRC